MVRRKGPQLAAGLLLLAALVVLHYLASSPKAPDIALETAESRELFPLDVALPDLQGKTVRLADLRNKVVVITFWATWCSPCRAEMPSMQALYQDYRDKGFEILAISIDAQGKDVVAPFVEAYGLTFPVLLDPGDVVSARLQIQGIPTSYVLDKHGRLASVEIGAKNWNSNNMRRVLDALLAEEANRITSSWYRFNTTGVLVSADSAGNTPRQGGPSASTEADQAHQGESSRGNWERTWQL